MKLNLFSLLGREGFRFVFSGAVFTLFCNAFSLLIVGGCVSSYGLNHSHRLLDSMNVLPLFTLNGTYGV
ncbi:hypothetical protein GBA52_020186 [Prunus armeniaca]|nr:hypothetical protein GBA52_020186 [Prunus armeniaca]